MKHTGEISMFPRSNALALALTVAAASFALPALAAPASDAADQVTAVVKITDLNLASSADQATLRHRVRRAAVHVCAAVTNGPGASNSDFGDCYKQAFNDGWRQAEIKIAAAQTRDLVASAAR
jgi:UrcA family protein